MTEELMPGQILPELDVVDLTVDGGAVARHQGRVIFLDDGLPGDRVSARVLAVEKRSAHACLEEILQPSEHRQKAWCPHFAECGACSWQDLASERLLAWKRDHVRQTLMRLGGQGEIPVAPIQASPLQRGYRNKMAFAFDVDGQERLRLGLRKRGSHEVVEVTDCGLQAEPTMAVVAYVRSRVAELGLTAWDGSDREKPQGQLRFLVLHMPEYTQEGPQAIVECICGPEETRRAREGTAEKVLTLGRELMERFALGGFLHTERRQRPPVAQAERVIASIGRQTSLERFGHLLLETPYDCFMQTNTGSAERLYAQAAACAGLTGSEVLWDIYCGAGGIGLYMAEQAKEVHGFDIQQAAITAARENSRRLGFSHCRFQSGDLRKTLLAASTPPDVILLDPPRAGLDADITRILADLPAKRMVYVSCDIGTQARDIARLQGTWRPMQAYPVDMFPHSPHVENIVVFTKK